MNKNLNMREMIDEVNRLSKLLKESYIFDQEEEMPMEEPIEGEMMEPEDDMQVGQMEDKVNQIRALALEGIQDFAEQVDSEEYQFYKKVWMLCDKMCSEKEKMSEND